MCYITIIYPCGKESTEVWKSQIKGKESENSYQKLKRSPKDRHTQTVLRYFDWHGRLSQSDESKCLWIHDQDGIVREFTKGATRGRKFPSINPSRNPLVAPFVNTLVTQSLSCVHKRLTCFEKWMPQHVFVGIVHLWFFFFFGFLVTSPSTIVLV